MRNEFEEENRLIKKKVSDLETRITMMNARRVQRKYFRLERDREIRKRIAAVIAELDNVLKNVQEE